MVSNAAYASEALMEKIMRIILYSNSLFNAAL